MTTKDLLHKYNVAGPRYTSYPTVPYWQTDLFNVDDWQKTVVESFNESNNTKGISLYIHLPFCEQLCTFCACHKHITKRHQLEIQYINALLKEWELYLQLFPEKPVLKELHLGGGTPTFFSPEHLHFLLRNLLKKVNLPAEIDFSFEGHPNNTTKEHLQALYDLGFTRVSFGVQDYSPKVQKAINRVQPFENVEAVTMHARDIGYTSISHDLIFGLPFQNVHDIIDTIDKTISLEPERISFYSYAHVPWIKGVGQRGFDENDIPKGSEKRKLYELGKYMLHNLGYREIGMDHFALPGDDLYRAFEDEAMHRNFMGYTTNTTQLLIGLGMSAISDSWYGFAQNEKSLKDYEKRVSEGRLPITKGHILTEEDLIIRKHILNIMCHFKTSWQEKHLQFKGLPEVLDRLERLEKDGLVIITDDTLMVPRHKKAFVRNVCMAFDLKMIRSQPEKQLFSMTI